MPLNKTEWVKHKNIWTVSYIMWIKYPHLVFIFVPNSAYSNVVVASSRNLKSEFIIMLAEKEEEVVGLHGREWQPVRSKTVASREFDWTIKFEEKVKK